MSGARGEWPKALQEVFAAARRSFPFRLRGYDRQEVDQALREAVVRLGKAVEEADGYVELADVLDEQLAEARATLAEYDRLHAGEEVCRATDEATRDAVARARREADVIVEDARREARLVVDREEQALAARITSLENAELEGRQRLADSTAAAGEVVRAAGVGCARLLARVAGRQRVVEEWSEEFAELLDVLPSFQGTVEIPRSRRPEEAGTPRARAVEPTPAATEAV